jgi:hypothetical protein
MIVIDLFAITETNTVMRLLFLHPLRGRSMQPLIRPRRRWYGMV